MNIEEKIKDVIVENLGIKLHGIKRESSFVDDFGIDSLDSVELVMAIEEEFNIEIPDGDAEKIQTVGQLIEYVERKVQ